MRGGMADCATFLVTAYRKRPVQYECSRPTDMIHFLVPRDLRALKIFGKVDETRLT